MKYGEEYRIKISILIGSLQRNSNTKKAAKAAAEELENFYDVDVTLIDPRHFRLNFPGLDDFPDDTEKFIEVISESDGIIMATPEYNGTFSSVLKLMIEKMGYPSILDGKPVSLIGVASGKIGAIKALEHLRSVCAHCGAITLPYPVSIAEVFKYFDEDGVIDDEIFARLKNVGCNLVSFIRQSGIKERDAVI